MQLTLKHTATVLVLIIGLIGLNVYQWQNPTVVEAPAGTTEIDSTAWVQRNAYTTRGGIIDSLRAQNEALADQVYGLEDAIFSYSNLTGRLRLQKDSLQNELEQWHELPNQKSSITNEQSYLEQARQSARELQAFMDSTFMTQRTFGDGLFLVTGMVEFRGTSFRQHLDLEQLREIRIDVATTVNDEHNRVLTYVTSKDFESIEYQSFTQLKPKQKRMPWFWIGLATGVAGAALIIE